MRQWMLKSGIIFISIVMIAVQIPVFAATERTLTLKQVTALTVANSDAVNLVRLNIVKKKIERKEAVEGLKDIREKETTVRFSLLFNIEFPETHGMPKEIDLLLKLPKVDNEIKKLNAKLNFETLKATYEATSAYYDILSAEAAEAYYTKRVASLETDYQKLNLDYLMGKAKSDDVKLLKETLESERKQLITAVLDLNQKRGKLSTMTGLTIDEHYVLAEEPISVSLARSDLQGLIDYGLGADYQVFAATEDRKLSEKTVTEIYEIYKNQFGSKANVLSKYINQSKIDYVGLTQDYEKMLNNIDKPWQKVFVINMIFFKIKIPMRWFQGEYTALRYFEDEKYPLIIALGERDEMRVTEQTAIAEATQKIQTSFESVLQMQLAAIQMEKSLKEAQTLYDQLYAQNLSGTADYAAVLAQRNTVEALTLAKYQLEITLRQFIVTLDFNTAGGVSEGHGGTGFKAVSLDDGISTPDADAGLTGATWYVQYPYEQYQFIFGINLPETLKLTHYQLCTENDVALSERLTIDKTFAHLPMAFEDQTKLKVKLYQKDQLMYEASLEGDDIAGTLLLVPVTQAGNAAGTVAGGYTIEHADVLQSTLNMTLSEDVHYDQYAIQDKNGVLLSAAVDKGTPLTTLSLTLNALNDIIVVCYKEGDVVGKLSFKAVGDTSGQMVWVTDAP
jgi:hypothetical protein